MLVRSANQRAELATENEHTASGLDRTNRAVSFEFLVAGHICGSNLNIIYVATSKVVTKGFR